MLFSSLKKKRLNIRNGASKDFIAFGYKNKKWSTKENSMHFYDGDL